MIANQEDVDIEIEIDLIESDIVAGLLADTKWLSKDVLFVAADGRFGEAALGAWLKEYHSSQQGATTTMDASSTERFLRAGIIRAAVHMDFVANSVDYLVVSVGTIHCHRLR